MAGQGIGASVLRKEDRRFITGRGRYVDDIRLDHELFAVFVRAAVAHGTLKSVGTAEALATDGVVAVYTGDDVAADELGPLPCGWMIHSVDGSEMKAPPHPVLAQGRVRYVGEAVAVVIGESLDAAKAGAEAVAVEIDDLPPVTAPAEAQASGAPQLHEAAPGNLCYHWELGDGPATDAAFDCAHHVTRLAFANNRLIPNAIEPRAAIGAYDPGTGDLTLYTTSQNPHVARLVLTAFVGLAPEHKLRVVAPDVGGGFGSKIFIYAEETVCAWASKKIGRPVRWTADRSESFLNDAHGRDHVTEAELALDADGTFLGLRVRTTANLGAYLSTFASSVPTYLYGTLLAGQYTTPAIHVAVDAVFTNTAPVDAYRGAGRPEATYVVERLVEAAARDLGLDPVEIRRRNFIPPDAFPYETPVALVYDTGNYQASLDRALEMVDYAGFPVRRAEAEARGKRRGIGFSCYIEACGLAPSKLAGQLGAGVGLFESAQVRMNPTGSVTVFTGAHSHGQGHETTFAQVVADKLGVAYDDVEVVHGDTGNVQYGLGTYGSRSLAVGGSAIVQATDKIIAKGLKIAAHKLGVGEDELAFEDGSYKVIAGNEFMTIQEVAFAAYVPFEYPDGLEPGLDEQAFYDPANFTYPAGTHICEVEIDPDTGVTEIVGFTAVDDFGRIVNPMIVEGQVHGGVAQGIGQALLEHGVYEGETGQLVTGSYMDYAMPRADDLPDYAVDLTETPCTHNPLGVKGCGEAGAIGSPAAFINAVTNALGVRDIAMPATAQRIWNIVQNQ